MKLRRPFGSLDMANAPKQPLHNAKGGSKHRPNKSSSSPSAATGDLEQDDTYNYALLIALYTIQGIPLGLSASIPFLIQQKVQAIAKLAASASSSSTAAAAASSQSASSVSQIAYNSQAVFSLVSWPFSLKLLWAPIVDALFFKRWGRRKTWLVPMQLSAGLLMILGSGYVEDKIGLGNVQAISGTSLDDFDVKGVTVFFFILYFLMATQDIAVDGWALTMLSKRNRGRGPVCNSIGQNIGFFLAFVGFLALNDPESCEKLWRPLLRLRSRPGESLLSLGGFIKSMGAVTIAVTCVVALFKPEVPEANTDNATTGKQKVGDGEDEIHQDAEIDASQIGIRETYKRIFAVCQLPAVRTLSIVLLTCRFPTVLSDKVKLLKAVEFGLSKQTTALLAPTIILPLGIMVPIIAAKIWKSQPLTQLMTAYKIRVTLVPILDNIMLYTIRNLKDRSTTTSQILFWTTVAGSTALSTIVDSLQFNAQMVFFAQRVDPEIGGTYMTLLNTVANLGSVLPQPMIMYLMGRLTVEPVCTDGGGGGGVAGEMVCEGGKDAYVPLSILLSVLGCVWVYVMGSKVKLLGELPMESWRTHNRKEGVDEESDNDKKEGKAA